MATSARAEDAGALSQREILRARAEFREGVELARHERWEEAEAAFLRAWALYPEPLVLFNLAATQVQLGRLIDGRATYRQFVLRAGERHAQYREAATQELDSIARRLGHLEIVVAEIEDGDVVEVDGEAVSLEGSIEVDPGRHVVVVRRGSADVAREEVDVEEGATATVQLTVVIPERVVVVVDREERRRLSAGAWVGIGAAILAVAGGVVTAVVLTTRPEDPFEGNVPPGVVTLE